MAGERHNLDVRGLDALGTPYGYDADPRGAIRLRSRPGPFTKHPANPIFDVGEGNAWDNAVVSEAKVVFDGETYHLWYAARQRLETPTGGKKSPMLVGYATSPDGLRWTRYPDNPIMVPGPLGSPEANFVYPPYVLFDGQQFRMWYSAHDFEEWSINYATSTDGAVWDKYPANPLMRAAHDGRWDENFISEPSVLWNGQRFEMWYNGGSERTSTLRVGYAWSDDGLAWRKWQPDEWVLDVGSLGTWDDFSVARVYVLYDGERYQMFYEGHDVASWRLGYAWSEDGVTWHKDVGNPILDLGPSGAFDSDTAAEPYGIFDGETYRLYYSGYDGDKYRIGLATAPPVYEPEGFLISAPLDGERRTYWGELTWACRLPEGTDIRLEVATSDDGETWSEWRVAVEGSAGGENSTSLLDLGLPASRYFRYRARLTTTDPARSPVLEEVSITEAVGDFTLNVQPTALTLPLGEAGSYSVGLSPRYGFDEAVSLAVAGLPEGVVAHAGDGPRPEPFVPGPKPLVLWPKDTGDQGPVEGMVTLPAELSLSVSSDLASPAGAHSLTIEGVSAGGITQAVTVSLVLLAPTPTPTPRPAATPTATPVVSPSASPSTLLRAGLRTGSVEPSIPLPTATLGPTPATTPTPVPSVWVSGSFFVVAGVVGLVLTLAVVGLLVCRAGRSRGSE